jgi:hypothetical protein
MLLLTNNMFCMKDPSRIVINFYLVIFLILTKGYHQVRIPRIVRDDIYDYKIIYL